MKCVSGLLSLCGLFLVFGAVNIPAQQPSSSPTPTPTSPPQITKPQVTQQQIYERRESQKQRSAGTKQISGSNSQLSRGVFVGSTDSITSLYRKTSKKELKLLAPLNEDVNKFAEFLRQPDTGLLKLAADKGCSENPNIVVATEDCLTYSMPGAGSSYSFRVKDYRLPRLADITLTDNSFQATGVRLHGIFVNIGDVSLEQTNLTTKGLNYLVDFKPEADFQKAKEIDNKFSAGIQKDGFLYRRAAKVQENTTYVLRSIAYRGTYYRANAGVTYNELDFDKRKDIIVAFRIVRRDEDGALTILWKLLAKQDSPKTTWRKDDKNNKGKSTDFISKGK